MQKYLFALLIAFAYLSPSFSQNKSGSIKGVVSDSAGNQILPLATVTVYRADTSLVTFRLSNPQGEFRVPGLPLNTKLRMVVTFSGFEAYRKDFTLSADTPDLDAGKIQMIPTSETLEEVLVLAERPPIIYRRDTIEFNAEAFKALPSALVEDLLKKLPGVDLDNEGNISVNGRKVNRILVDGRDFFAGDTKMATQNLPADIVDKVQVMNDKEEKQRNPNTPDDLLGQVINLKLKKGIKKGWFGKVYGGAGTDKLYEAGFGINTFRDTLQLSLLGFTNNINRSSFSMSELYSLGGFGRGGMPSVAISSDGVGGERIQLGNMSFGGMGGGGHQKASGAGMNFNTVFKNKMTVNLRYFYGTNKNRNLEKVNIQQFFNDTIMSTRNETSSNAYSAQHNLGGKLEWSPDTLTSIRFVPDVTMADNDSRAFKNVTNSTNFHDPINSSANNSRSFSDSWSYNHDFVVERAIDRSRKNTLKIYSSLKYGANRPDLFNDIINKFYYPQQNESEIIQFRETKAGSFGNFQSVQLEHRISKKLYAIFSYNYSFNREQNKITTLLRNPQTGLYEIYQADLSDDVRMDNASHMAAADLSYRYQSVFVTGGLRLQKQRLDSRFLKDEFNVVQKYSNIWSDLQIYVKGISVSYMTSVSAPPAADLRVATDNADPLFLRTGNPDLKPFRSHSFYVNFRKSFPSRLISINFYAYSSLYRNKIIYARSVDANGVQTTRPENANGSYYLMASVFASKQYKFGQNFSGGVNLAFSTSPAQNIVLVNHIKSFERSLQLSPSLTLLANWKDIIELSPTIGITDRRSRFTSDYFNTLKSASLFFKNQLILRWPKRLVWETNLLYTRNDNVAAGFEKSFTLWNAALSFQFLKNDQAVLKFTVFDILNQNRNFERASLENGIIDKESLTLRQYFMLTASYNIRSFKSAKKVTQNNWFFRF